MTLELRAAVVPQDAVQQLLARLPDGHRWIDGGADAVVVQDEVLVKPLQPRYRVPAAGSRDGSVDILSIKRLSRLKLIEKYKILTPNMFSRL